MSEESKPIAEKDELADMADERPLGIIEEFWIFLTENKKWWLTPILLVLLMVTALVVLGATPAAPFIYALF